MANVTFVSLLVLPFLANFAKQTKQHQNPQRNEQENALSRMRSITSVLSAFCLSAQNNGEIIIIVQQDEPITPPGAPRSPEYNPFFAELVGNSILLGSMSSCGSVSVEIASTAGDNYSVYFDTSTGMILLPISGIPGDYTIRITTPLGVHYIGEFTI